jgi:hypothetical protein
MAFAQLEPFGGAVDDLRAGIGPAVAVNMNRAEGADPVSAMAFFPWHDKQPEVKPEPKPETPDEIAQKWRRLLSPKGKPDGSI